MLTVEEIMVITGLKRGVIDQFRNELQKFGLIEKNQSLDSRALSILKMADEYREEEKNTWAESMEYAIRKEYGEEMNLPFTWTKDIILKDLIWKIKNEKIKVRQVEDGISEDFHIVYYIIIENFKEMAKTNSFYRNSSGTDGNPITTFICQGKDYIYYVVGKYNAITKNEDIHVFYNDGVEFNTMKCKHICGGSADKGRIKDLWIVCKDLIYGEK